MAEKFSSLGWYFTKDELNATPSIKAGMNYEKELMYRQQCANLIQDMGQKLSVNQLCISTAIVYMHRFYMIHSFTNFSRHSIAACSIFLAAKVEEQFRKVEHVVKVLYACQFKEKVQPIDVHSDLYQSLSSELIFNESILLQTLGFDITIDHPHSHVVKCCQLIRAPKDLAQVSYIMATNSLHLTLHCLQYRPSVVACICIYIACKWSNWEIPRSTEGKEWFWYIDKDVTLDVIQGAMEEFMNIYAKSPHKLKMKLFKKSSSPPPSISGNLSGGNVTNNSTIAQTDDTDNIFDNNDEKSALTSFEDTTSTSELLINEKSTSKHTIKTTEKTVVNDDTSPVKNTNNNNENENETQHSNSLLFGKLDEFEKILHGTSTTSKSSYLDKDICTTSAAAYLKMSKDVLGYTSSPIKPFLSHNHKEQLGKMSGESDIIKNTNSSPPLKGVKRPHPNIINNNNTNMAFMSGDPQDRQHLLSLPPKTQQKPVENTDKIMTNINYKNINQSITCHKEESSLINVTPSKRTKLQSDDNRTTTPLLPSNSFFKDIQSSSLTLTTNNISNLKSVQASNDTKNTQKAEYYRSSNTTKHNHIGVSSQNNNTIIAQNTINPTDEYKPNKKWPPQDTNLNYQLLEPGSKPRHITNINNNDSNQKFQQRILPKSPTLESLEEEKARLVRNLNQLTG